MQIRFAMPLALVLCFMLFACQENSQVASAKMAVVDLARLMSDSAPGREGIKFLESRQAAIQEKLDAMQEKLEKNPQDDSAMQEYQRFFSMAQQRMQAEQQNVVSLLFDTVQRVLNSYRTDNGYEVIISADAVQSYNPALDITASVLGEINKQKIEFKPLPEAQATQDKPADEAAQAAGQEAKNQDGADKNAGANAEKADKKPDAGRQ